MTGAWLAGAALVLAAAFGAMAGVGDLYRSPRAFVALFVVASAAYAAAAVRVARRPPSGRRPLVAIVLAAVVFRLIVWPTVPSLSTDLYRYLWDGRLAAAGVSPYRYAADAPEVARFRDVRVYPGLNHPDWHTIYPPGAQLIFWSMARLAPADVWAFKALLVLVDLGATGLLLGWLGVLGRPRAWVLLYAWHPLVVVEVAGSGHLEPLVVAASLGALWAATRGSSGWSGTLLGLAALVKLYPLVLLPAVWGRRPARALVACGVVVAAGYALYAPDGGTVLGSLPRYVAEERFNGAVRPLLDFGLASLGGPGRLAARLLPLAGLAARGVVVSRSAWPAPRRALWLGGGYLLAAPGLFPWYAVWVIPLAAATLAWPWLSLACAVALSYVALADPLGAVPPWVMAVEFAPLAAGLALAAWRRSSAPAVMRPPEVGVPS